MELSILGLKELETRLPPTTSHIISLVDPGCVLPVSLLKINDAHRLVLRVHDALDAGCGIVAPQRIHAEALCRFAKSIDPENLTHLVVHCHMGRSRSAAAAAIVLLTLGCDSPGTALGRVQMVRDPVWPNHTLIEHGDALLGLSGSLITACKELYESVRIRHPEWVCDPVETNIRAADNV